MGKITKKSFVTVSGEMQPYEYTRTIKLFDKKILKTCVFYKRKIWSLKMTSIYSIKKCVEKLVSDFIFLFAGALSHGRSFQPAAHLSEEKAGQRHLADRLALFS